MAAPGGYRPVGGGMGMCCRSIRARRQSSAMKPDVPWHPGYGCAARLRPTRTIPAPVSPRRHDSTAQARDRTTGNGPHHPHQATRSTQSMCIGKRSATADFIAFQGASFLEAGDRQLTLIRGKSAHPKADRANSTVARRREGMRVGEGLGRRAAFLSASPGVAAAGEDSCPGDEEVSWPDGGGRARSCQASRWLA
jgi:hypothetical protein